MVDGRPIIQDNVRTLDESRKWILQSIQKMQEGQVELYNIMQELNHLVSEHKIAYDNVHDNKLAESQRYEAYNDAVNLRAQMNDTLNKWFEKYGDVSF